MVTWVVLTREVEMVDKLREAFKKTIKEEPLYTNKNMLQYKYIRIEFRHSARGKTANKFFCPDYDKEFFIGEIPLSSEIVYYIFNESTEEVELYINENKANSPRE